VISQAFGRVFLIWQINEALNLDVLDSLKICIWSYVTIKQLVGPGNMLGWLVGCIAWVRTISHLVTLFRRTGFFIFGEIKDYARILLPNRLLQIGYWIIRKSCLEAFESLLPAFELLFSELD
jgi:hypothetical protein